MWPWAYYMGLTLWSHRFTFMFGLRSNGYFVISAPCMIGVTVMALLPELWSVTSSNKPHFKWHISEDNTSYICKKKLMSNISRLCYVN